MSRSDIHFQFIDDRESTVFILDPLLGPECEAGHRVTDEQLFRYVVSSILITASGIELTHWPGVRAVYTYGESR